MIDDYKIKYQLTTTFYTCVKLIFRTQKMAVDILSSVPNCKQLVILCVLKGGYKFCSELVDCMERYICSCEINMSIKVEFIRLKSYHVSDRLVLLSKLFCTIENISLFHLQS